MVHIRVFYLMEAFVVGGSGLQLLAYHLMMLDSDEME